MSIFFLTFFKVIFFQCCVNILYLVETSDDEVLALSSHCATTKELSSPVVNFLYE